MRALTRKQKAWADEALNDKAASLTEITRRVYKGVSPQTARVIGSQNIRKANILSYLEQHSDIAEETIVDVMHTARNKKSQPAYARLALDSANSILDRVHGKATQRHDVLATGVTLNIDLTSSLQDEGAPS